MGKSFKQLENDVKNVGGNVTVLGINVFHISKHIITYYYVILTFLKPPSLFYTVQVFKQTSNCFSIFLNSLLN